MKIRITVACPADMRDDANSFAMVMANGPADAATYNDASFRDATGNIYAAASFEVPVEWVSAAQSTLERPEWDGDDGYTVNMAGARRAQDAIVFWTPAMGGPTPQATPDTLLAIGGIPGPDALREMGLATIEVGL